MTYQKKRRSIGYRRDFLKKNFNYFMWKDSTSLVTSKLSNMSLGIRRMEYNIMYCGNFYSIFVIRYELDWFYNESQGSNFTTILNKNIRKQLSRPGISHVS